MAIERRPKSVEKKPLKKKRPLVLKLPDDDKSPSSGNQQSPPSSDNLEKRRISREANKLRANEEKWGAELVAAGWTMVPTVLLQYQRELGLDATDLNLLLQIAKYWWRPGVPPRPSIRSIAASMNLSVSTVQRRISSLRSRDLLKVVTRLHPTSKARQANAYQFDGLIEKATEFAKIEIARRRQERLEREERERQRLAD